MRALARQAVTRFAGMEPGRPVGGTYYLYRTLRNLDLDGVLERLMEAARERGDRRAHAARGAPRARRVRVAHRPAAEGDRGRDPAPARRRPRRRGHGQHAAQAAARGRRLHARHAARRWARCAARSSRSPASSRCAWPASGATAARARSTSATPCATRSRYGGVPAEPKFRYPRPAKPEIIVVADISGSVAAFARFTLQLVYAISSQFSKVRVVRVHRRHRRGDAASSRATEDINEAVHRVNTEADVIWVDGHSDYGHAFAEFWNRWGHEVDAEDLGDPARRRPEQLPRLAGLGGGGAAHGGPATSSGSTPSPAPTGTPATRSSPSTAPTATACSSAATCASSSGSSSTSPSGGSEDAFEGLICFPGDDNIEHTFASPVWC